MRSQEVSVHQRVAGYFATYASKVLINSTRLTEQGFSTIFIQRIVMQLNDWYNVDLDEDLGDASIDGIVQSINNQLNQ